MIHWLSFYSRCVGKRSLRVRLLARCRCMLLMAAVPPLCAWKTDQPADLHLPLHQPRGLQTPGAFPLQQQCSLVTSHSNPLGQGTYICHVCPLPSPGLLA
jgi:hypothetical protein